MSVKFILGPTGEERSKLIYEHAVNAASDPEKKVLVIVPEQYTLDTQKGLINAHPCHALLNIDVVSFNRLAYKVLGKVGGGNTPIIRDSGKAMIIRKILKGHEKSLKFFAPKMRKKGLVGEMKSLISEFDQYGLSVDELEGLTARFETEKNSSLSKKLSDISLIFNEFHKEINERFITREELLDVLKRRLDETSYLKDSYLFFDGFTGFTTTQYRLLETLIRQASGVEISVTYDGDKIHSSESDPMSGNLFFMSDDFMNRVTDAAGNVNVKADEYIFCKSNEKSKAENDLEFLKHNIFRKDAGKVTYDGKADGISIREAADAREEISLVINEIYDLTRNNGYRYRDIAVVTEDPEKYGDMAFKLMEHNGFPVFLDQRRSVSENPYIENIRALLRIIINGWTYENIFRFLKTGFSGIERASIDMLDNYCLATGINTKDRWKSEWTNPAKKIKKDTDGNRVAFYDLELLNGYRQTVATLIEAQEKKIKKAGNVAEMADVLKGYLSSDMFNTEPGSLTERIAEKTDKILDEVTQLFGSEEASPDEFAEILDSAFEELSLGFIPPTVDCITIGDVDRTRLTNIKALFVVGVNDGVIPKSNSDSGILTQAERLKIAESDISLSPSNKDKAFIQRFYLYLLFTKPFDKLYISYAKKDLSGESIGPSYLIKNIRDMFPELKTQGVDEETKKSFQIWLPESRTVWTPDDGATCLSPETATLLYGNELRGSVSSFERYAGCPFSYFLNSGLRLSPREIYDFNPADFGSVVHDVLKNVVSGCMNSRLDLDSINDSELEKIVLEETGKASEKYFILREGGRKSFTKRRIEELSLISARTIGKQLARGEFRPDLLEHSFILKRKLPEGKKLIFNGMIDRVDTALSDSGLFVRVVDYKTGDQEFSLEKAYYGIQIQLINYLRAAVEEEKARNKGKDIIPAGMLYYNISNPLADESNEVLSDERIEEEIISELKMTGVVSAENEAVSLTDSDKTGAIVKSVGFGRSGELKASRNLFDSDKLKALSEFEAEKMDRMASEILRGNADINPLIDFKEKSDDMGGKNTACYSCDFREVCNFSKDLKGVRYKNMKHMKEEEIWERIRDKKDV